MRGSIEESRFFLRSQTLAVINGDHRASHVFRSARSEIEQAQVKRRSVHEPLARPLLDVFPAPLRLKPFSIQVGFDVSRAYDIDVYSLIGPLAGENPTELQNSRLGGAVDCQS
jgi:hypothetical protein